MSNFAISGTPTSQITTSDSGSLGAIGDFNSFIKLLTVQMTNQDPLEPQDPTQFTEQLATFSMLEQQIKANTLLTSMNGVLSAGDFTTVTSLLGHEVQRADKSWTLIKGVEFGDGNLLLNLADGSQITMSDISGVRVPEDSKTAEIPVGL